MILEKGNIWNIIKETDALYVTTNSYISLTGELVMGRGLAKEAKEKLPELPRIFGNEICKLNAKDRVYGTIEIKASIPIADKRKELWLGAFQVKRHFKEKASLSLIGYSTTILIEKLKKFKFKKVDMNFPGIGFGYLDRNQVLPIIEEFNDTVHIWEKE